MVTDGQLELWWVIKYHNRQGWTTKFQINQLLMHDIKPSTIGWTGIAHIILSQRKGVIIGLINEGDRYSREKYNKNYVSLATDGL